MSFISHNRREFATVIFFYLIGHALLCPEKGTGIYDNTFFETSDRASMWMFVGIVFVVLFLLTTGSNVGNEKRLISLISTLFSAAVVVRSFPTAHNIHALLAVNTCLGPMCLVVCCLLLYRSRIFTAFPYLLVGVFLAYGFTVCNAVFLQNRVQLDGYTYHFDTVNRLCVVFDHPNHLGNLLAFGIILSFASAVMSPTALSCSALWLLITSMVTGLVATLSRGSWIGCIAGLSISVIYLWRRTSHRRLGISLITLALVTTTVVFSGGFGHSVSTRLASSKPSDDASVGNRLLVMHRALGIVRNHWLLGVGIGRFGKTLDDTEHSEQAQRGRYNSALNNYLNLAAEAGVPTLVIYLLAISYACIVATRRLAHTGWDAGTQIGMLCGVYSMLVFGLTTYTLSRVYANVLVGSVMGYLVSLQKPGMAEPNETMLG